MQSQTTVKHLLHANFLDLDEGHFQTNIQLTTQTYKNYLALKMLVEK